MITKPKHTISIVVAGADVRNWESYSVETSLTDGIDTFRMQLPFSRDAWDLLKPGRPIQILVDGSPILTGFIDSSDCPEGSDAITVAGRNRVGHLDQESAPGINFSGLGVKELIEKLAKPMFSEVTFSNAENRKIVRGRGKKAISSEPVRLNTRVGTQIEPGQTRLAVILQLCEQAGYLVWSSGNGRQLIVGLPNDKLQGVQYRFFRPSPGSARAAESTVMSIGLTRAIGHRYSRIICVGSGVGTDVNYGTKVASRYGEARNNPAKTNGEGKDFIVPKTLIIQRSVKSAREAREFAVAEMARRDAQAEPITVTAAGHGQVVAGKRTTLFALDTLAAVEDERTSTSGHFTIIGCSYTGNRGEAEKTTMQLMPKGAVLSR